MIWQIIQIKHRMVEGNYLKLHKETAGGNLYYIDYKLKDFNIYILCLWKLSNTTNKNGEQAK